jgi:imidazolonepropionase-like amidohydrolase
MSMRHRAFASALLLAAALPCQNQVVVFQGARILPGGGPAIDDGVLVVTGGKVTAVGGKGTAVPSGAEVRDVSGRTITPGLIDAGAQIGAAALDRNEQGDEVTPSVHVLDAFDPADKALRRARQGGVTALHLTPGNKNVIGGLSAVVKTWGENPAAMLLKDETGMRLTMGSEPSQNNRAIRGGNIDSMYYRRPTTRMGVVWTARKAFYDAKAYQETLASNPKADPGMQVLNRVLKGELLVFTTARAEQDIRTALRLMDEFGYKTAIEEAQEAWRVVDELVAAKVWVLVGAPSADRVLGSGAGDVADPRFHTLRLLHERGVPFVITTGSNAQALDLVREATVAVRHGLPALAALDAVTIQPARLLSVQDRIGSLSAGKDADFVVWSSNPFDPTARAEAVYVNGTRVNE